MPDGLDDEIRRLNRRIEELEELIRTIFEVEEAEQEEKAAAPAGTEDLYDVGRDSYMVESLGEYEEMRKAAATSQDMLLPSISPSAEESETELYTESFIRGYDSLDSLKRGLSKINFETVVREVFIASTLSSVENVTYTLEEGGEIEEYSITSKEASLMIELSSAVPDVFGISEDVSGGVKFSATRSPMALLNVYDSFWFVRTPPYFLNDIAKPWESLGLRTPGPVEAAINSENPIDALANAGVLVGGGAPMRRFLRTAILPKVVRRDRNGLIEMPEGVRELAEFLDMV